MPFATHPDWDGWRSEACRDLTGYDFDNQGRAELPIEASMSCFSFTARCQSEPNIALSVDFIRSERRGLSDASFAVMQVISCSYILNYRLAQEVPPEDQGYRTKLTQHTCG